MFSTSLFCGVGEAENFLNEPYISVVANRLTGEEKAVKKKKKKKLFVSVWTSLLYSLYSIYGTLEQEKMDNGHNMRVFLFS